MPILLFGQKLLFRYSKRTEAMIPGIVRLTLQIDQYFNRWYLIPQNDREFPE